jgi:hypothetical protein
VNSNLDVVKRKTTVLLSGGDRTENREPLSRSLVCVGCIRRAARRGGCTQQFSSSAAEETRQHEIICLSVSLFLFFLASRSIKGATSLQWLTSANASVLKLIRSDSLECPSKPFITLDCQRLWRFVAKSRFQVVKHTGSLFPSASRNF